MVVIIEAYKAVDPPQGSEIYIVGVLESTIGGSTFWILSGVWEMKRLEVQSRSLRVQFSKHDGRRSLHQINMEVDDRLTW